jgi:Fe-S cluster biosynthesis and repair protein YggX
MEVKIINEYRLNLLEREHRKVLKKHMHDFLDVDGKGQSAATPGAIASEWTPEA